MRGKASQVRCAACSARITPAYAGKRHRIRCSTSFPMGSPPPMRGKVLAVLIFYLPLGITPAYAGKRKQPLVKCFFAEDHPRLCGEKACEESQRVCTEGSPPPMRGKGHHSGVSAFSLWITPAYAGKRYTPKQKKRCRQDHPRLCGEKAKVEQDKPKVLGSPPPMRGKAV